MQSGSGEECDDSNQDDGDGCNSTCHLESGYTCYIPNVNTQNVCIDGTLSFLTQIVVCGNGINEGNEKCDCGGDLVSCGCKSDCSQFLVGYYCLIEPTVIPNTACITECGDGIMAGSEDCDDGNTRDNDGCTDCSIDSYYDCKEDFNLKSICTPFCGNGFIDLDEVCDDYNLVSNDGCTSCKVDQGWACSYKTDRSVCTERPTAEISFISSDNTISITFSQIMKQISLDESLFSITITKPSG